MESFLVFFIISFITFFFTSFFSFSYRYFKNFKISAYAKCLAGGIILSTLLFHILPDVCNSQYSSIGQLFTGISFLLLFTIDKLYLYDGENANDSLPKNITKTQAYIFVIALSLHSFLEGLGIGAKTGKSLIWYVIGLLGHKWIEAFALSVSVHTSGFDKNDINALLILYSALTPIGTLAGTSLISVLKHNRYFHQFECALNGTACGSFFYIEFIEMLTSEFENRKKCRNKLVSVFFGFIIMTLASFAVAYAESK